VKVQRSSGAVLSRTSAPRDIRLALLVLHGGSADSAASVGRWNLAALRLSPVARSLARGVPGAAVYRLRNSVRGWNGDGLAVLADARWAVDRMTTSHPGVPLVVVGHSLGGRVAVHLAAENGREDGGVVVGAVGLAPWLEPGDPVTGLRGVPVAVVQGTGDRMIPTPSTEPWLSRASAAGATVRRSVVRGGEHAMLRRHRQWHRLAVESVAWVLSSAQRSVRVR
jgi:alpha-beta hydrolase superfamily lysophospholipase